MEVYYDENAIHDRVRLLGQQITADYGDFVRKGGRLVLVGVLNGAFVFMADLIREIPLEIETDFMIVTSYREGTEAENIEIVKDITCNIKDCHVIVIEDILDTGQTLSLIVKMLKNHGALSVKSCVLLNKKARRVCKITAEYIGFEIGNKFVVGCGLDRAGKYRNLRYIAVKNE